MSPSSLSNSAGFQALSRLSRYLVRKAPNERVAGNPVKDCRFEPPASPLPQPGADQGADRNADREKEEQGQKLLGRNALRQ